MKFLKSLIVSCCMLSLVSCDVIQMGSSNSEGSGGVNMLEKVELSLFENAKQIRFSSYSSGSENGATHYLKQIAPYDDSYKIKTNEYTSVELYDKDGNLIDKVPAKTRKSIELKKDDVVLIDIDEKYYWEGKMRLGIPCTPAWYPEQHEDID